MSNIVILGAGTQSVTTSKALQTLGYDIVLIDCDSVNLNTTLKYLKPTTTNILVDADDSINIIRKQIVKIKPDFVISCLPYDKNYRIAKLCIDKDIGWADLGGNKSISDSICNYAKMENANYCLTDLGLAPGLINILAQRFWEKNPHFKNIDMYCGGLTNENSSVHYKRTFSLQGLINEYTGTYHCIDAGYPITGQVSTKLCEKVIFNSCNYEAFYTSGCACRSIDYFLQHCVENFTYSTLRHEGHLAAIEQMKQHTGLDTAKVLELMEPQMPHTFNDYVAVVIKLSNVQENVVHEERIELELGNDSGNKISAMQRGTGYSAAAAIHTALYCGGALNYEDLHFGHYFNTLVNFLPEIEELEFLV